MRFSKLLPAVVLLASICNAPAAQTPARTDSSGAGRRLANTQWRLASFDDGAAPVIEGPTITLKFGADGRVGGSGGCNSYGGEYRERGDDLSFGQIISTKRACLEQGANEQEQRYFAALESASKFKLSEDRLTIYYGDGRSALNFVTDTASKSAARRFEGLDSGRKGQGGELIDLCARSVAGGVEGVRVSV